MKNVGLGVLWTASIVAITATFVAVCYAALFGNWWFFQKSAIRLASVQLEDRPLADGAVLKEERNFFLPSRIAIRHPDGRKVIICIRTDIVTMFYLGADYRIEKCDEG